jgi:hypothetical protein
LTPPQSLNCKGAELTKMPFEKLKEQKLIQMQWNAMHLLNLSGGSIKIISLSLSLSFL